MKHRRWSVYLGSSLVGVLMLAACLPSAGERLSGGEAVQPTQTQAEAEEPPAMLPPTETPTEVPPPTEEPPPVTASPTPLPSPTPAGEGGEATPAFDTPTPIVQGPTPVPPGSEPIAGSFDVYLSGPDEGGTQRLRWMNIFTRQTATEIAIRTDDGYAIRAGQYVYFLEAGSRRPLRVNTAGAVEPLPFADPPAGASFYQLLPSATGDYLAWLSVDGEGTSYTISLAYRDGSDARAVATGVLASGEAIELVRVTNDGRKIFYDRRPPEVNTETLFGGYYDLHVLDVESGVEARLPGEPACGLSRVCGGRVSPDGAFVVRTRPPTTRGAEVVVTSLVSGAAVARFYPEDIPSGVAYDIGYPFFTPGGEVVFVEGFGPPGLESYLLVFGSVSTGEQRVVADLGADRHRPLGWASDGVTLLTTREPGWYDTWQIDILSGEMRQIAAMLFLGSIQEPPPTP